MIRWENNMSTYEARSVAATFITQLERLSRDANDLLNILSFFDPESIPVKIVVEGATDIVHSRRPPEVMPMDLSIMPASRQRTTILQKMKKKWNRLRGRPPDCAKSQTDRTNYACHTSSKLKLLAAFICDQIELPKAIRELQDLSLVELRSNIDTPTLRIHNLVRFMVQESVREEDTERDWLKSAVTLVCAAFRRIEDPGAPDRWAECEMFVPHVQLLTIQWSFAHTSMDSELIHANIGIAAYLKRCGRYSEAEALYRQVLAGTEKQLGVEHPDTLSMVQNLATVFQLQGQYDKAEALYRQVLAGREKQLGDEHPDTLSTVQKLAFVFQQQGRYNDAEELYG
jgi:hypothetical protein